MEVLAIVLLATAALAYVAQALVSPQVPRSVASSVGGEARQRKEAALSALVELEEERAVGKLTTDDFERLQRRYEGEALRALVALDAEEPDSLGADAATADDALEREIATMRARLSCPSCGAPRREAGRCTACGR